MAKVTTDRLGDCFPVDGRILADISLLACLLIIPACSGRSFDAAAKLGNDVIMAENSHFYLDYYQTADRVRRHEIKTPL